MPNMPQRMPSLIFASVIFASIVSVSIASLSASALAGGNASSTIWSATKNNVTDTGWALSNPTGSSDFFDATYRVTPGIGNVERATIAAGLPITGIAVSVSDFGSGRRYPLVGTYQSNLAIDPSGETPDLSLPITSITSPALSPPAQFDFVAFDLDEGNIPAGATRVHAVAQLPPGDSGLLGVGADRDATPSGGSGFTRDGYATPSNTSAAFDLGLNIGQDNSATSSCQPAERRRHGRLRASTVHQGMGEGDQLTVPLRAGQQLDLAFFGSRAGDKLRLYFAAAACVPSIPIGPVLTSLADADGDGSYLRVNAPWPAGFGNQTFRFTAAWGNAACASGGAGFTNCVTIITRDDFAFGACDDGTVEAGFVVQIPSGSSDYFTNDFGSGIGQHGVVGLSVAALDAGTATPRFPVAGVSNANFAVDAAGHTPSLTGGGLLARIAPFTFPAGTFATTSAQYVKHAISVAGSSLGTHVHGWIQFPPGDSGLLGCGADTTLPAGCSYLTIDGFGSSAIPILAANWGIRLNTN